jgi:hypothetical protein
MKRPINRRGGTTAEAVGERCLLGSVATFTRSVCERTSAVASVNSGDGSRRGLTVG